ncbi:uncharacterized [Tachysurus ichikawai]
MVEPPATGGVELPALAANGAIFPEVSETESDSAAAAMSNTDIPVKKLPEVSSTETNPVSGEEEINVVEGNVMMEENSDAVMMETDQVTFKTPIKRKKRGRKATLKYAKKADQEAVESESDTENYVVVHESSVPNPAVSNILS